MVSESDDNGVFDSIRNAKLLRIRKTLNESDNKINKLRIMAMSRYGLLNNDVRKKAWLTMHSIRLKDNIFKGIDQNMITSHKDYHQVLMDVNRSLKRFPPGMEDVERMAMQDQLVNLIIRVLIAGKGLNYYQGFHDICVTFLLVLSEEESFYLISKLAKTHFIDFLAQKMDATMQLLYLIYAILELENPTLMMKLHTVSLEPFFALSWVITWFGHVLGNLSGILRMYDYFLGSDPIMPIYVSAAIVLQRHKEISAAETDFAQLHHLLTSLPTEEAEQQHNNRVKQKLSLEHLLAASTELYLRHPPTTLVQNNKLPKQVNLNLTVIGSKLLLQTKGGGSLGDSPDIRNSNKVAAAALRNPPNNIMKFIWQFNNNQIYTVMMVFGAVFVIFLSVFLKYIFFD